jgi:hypothetical protein
MAYFSELRHYMETNKTRHIVMLSLRAYFSTNICVERKGFKKTLAAPGFSQTSFFARRSGRTCPCSR